MINFFILISIILIGYFIICFFLWFSIRKTINENFFLWWLNNFKCKLFHYKHHFEISRTTIILKNKDNINRKKHSVLYSCHKCNRKHFIMSAPD
jgi:hypothetical protein